MRALTKLTGPWALAPPPPHCLRRKLGTVLPPFEQGVVRPVVLNWIWVFPCSHILPTLPKHTGPAGRRPSRPHPIRGYNAPKTDRKRRSLARRGELSSGGRPT